MRNIDIYPTCFTSALAVSYFDIKGLLFLRYPRIQATLDPCRSIFLRPSASNLAPLPDVIGQIDLASRTLPNRYPKRALWLLSIYLVRIRPFCFHLTRGQIEWPRRDLPSLHCGGATTLHLLIQATGFRSNIDVLVGSPAPLSRDVFCRCTTSANWTQNRLGKVA
jgi:hypothetical protein